MKPTFIHRGNPNEGEPHIIECQGCGNRVELLDALSNICPLCGNIYNLLGQPVGNVANRRESYPGEADHPKYDGQGINWVPYDQES